MFPIKLLARNSIQIVREFSDITLLWLKIHMQEEYKINTCTPVNAIEGTMNIKNRIDRDSIVIEWGTSLIFIFL